ncbi:sugar phosphate isomerase/epimerase family protein [Arthrobacter sp. S2(2024)]|uniref:sugar phosphate isomerase/epimerase family protein n=1 Tax=Arthrobacter sp. S2(2024) TaxID=3111911 RepID=UPI002FCA04BB
MTTTPAPKFGVDLITFYDPRFWGLSTNEELLELRRVAPLELWTTILDTLGAAGFTAIELTFPPADPTSAIDAFGSVEAFKAELDKRGMEVTSAFWAGSDHDWRFAQDIDAIVAEAEERADFIARAGGSVLVAGLPMRKTLGERPAFFVDAPYMQRMADIAHRVGEATLRHGIRTAFHTESNSTLWYERDIDLFLGLTDPRYVYFCPDSCHITLGGGDPVQVAERHASRIVLAHWKDAVGPMEAELVIDETVYERQQPFMCALGDGVVDWKGWGAAMARTPGSDTILIELDAAANPLAAMRAGKAVVEGLS